MGKVVIDANVFVSAAFGGVPLDAVSKAFLTGEVFLSPAVIEEIDGTIRRLSSKLGEEKTGYLLALWRRFQSHCTILAPKEKATICRDPKDDAYLHLASPPRRISWSQATRIFSRSIPDRLPSSPTG